MRVDATNVWVNAPDVHVNGDGTIGLELILVDDVWVLVNDGAVTVAGVT